MDEEDGLGKETHFEFKYNGGPARDSMSLLDAIDLHGEKRGIEIMARMGLRMPGFYLAFLGIVAAVLIYLGRLAYA
jgi:hypothetical protein